MGLATRCAGGHLRPPAQAAAAGRADRDAGSFSSSIKITKQLRALSVQKLRGLEASYASSCIPIPPLSARAVKILNFEDSWLRVSGFHNVCGHAHLAYSFARQMRRRTMCIWRLNAPATPLVVIPLSGLTARPEPLRVSSVYRACGRTRTVLLAYARITRIMRTSPIGRIGC